MIVQYYHMYMHMCRQLYEVAIQAAVSGRVIARETYVL